MLVFGQFVNSISGSVGYILQMTDKQKTVQNVILSAAVINVMLNMILIPMYGIYGAAFASMVSMVFWNLILVFMVRRYYNIWTIYLPFPSVR
jgi:O-antigen/teichoic acid export membrane protein